MMHRHQVSSSFWYSISLILLMCRLREKQTCKNNKAIESNQNQFWFDWEILVIFFSNELFNNCFCTDLSLDGIERVVVNQRDKQEPLDAKSTSNNQNKNMKKTFSICYKSSSISCINESTENDLQNLKLFWSDNFTDNLVFFKWTFSCIYLKWFW